jgi:hypothetical protein
MAKPTSLTAEEWAFWETWTSAQRLLMLELDRVLQRDYNITKAEFSVLRTLDTAPRRRMKVTELAAALGWDKSRVAHQLTRMERRALVARDEPSNRGHVDAIRAKHSQGRCSRTRAQSPCSGLRPVVTRAG